MKYYVSVEVIRAYWMSWCLRNRIMSFFQGRSITFTDTLLYLHKSLNKFYKREFSFFKYLLKFIVSFRVNMQ